VDIQQLLVGATGACIGVAGWLFVGLFIQRQAHAQRAKDAGRAVYFELGANLLTVFTALEYEIVRPLSRASFDRLLPELATSLPAGELQAIVLAYLGHAGYEQVTGGDLPEESRQGSLQALADAHETALRILRARVFSPREARSLAVYASEQQGRLMEASRAIEDQVVIS
jgi:hypothetical protein